MNRRELLKAAAAASLAGAASGAAPALAQEIPDKTIPKLRLKTFDYRGVRLLSGPFAEQLAATRERYYNLSSDSILKGFRRRAGLPAPGDDLKGWARHTSGATFGQWVSGMARMSCATGDTDLRKKAVNLVSEYAKTVGPDGDCHMSTYEWEKACCGLVDAALYANDPEAIPLLARMTEWASRSFDRSRSPATPMDRDGRRPDGTLEWYTLTENSYRAYQATGNPLFRNFGDLWRYNTYWDEFEDSYAPPKAWYLHSYSHINTFCGVAMCYALTGNPRWLGILRNAYRYATETQAYATGGYGPGEWSVPNDGTLGHALEIRSDSAEIPCGSWAGFKLSKYLLTFTGEAHYGEWIEALLYNGIGASLPVQADGTAYYYADYRLDNATKLYFWDQWPCCSGTYIQDVADYHDIIYLHDDRDLYVNLLLPSVVTWQRDGGTVVVRQETNFPSDGAVRFTVSPQHPTAFAVKLRVPKWAQGYKLSVNGEAVDTPATPGQWAEVRRIWQPGDVLALALDVPFHLSPVDKQHPNRAAVMYGPLVLAQEAIFTFPFSLDEKTPLAQRLRRETADLVFKVNDDTQHVQSGGDFRPLSAYRERTPYRVYFDLYAPRYL